MKQWLANLLLVAISTTVTLGAGEIVLRQTVSKPPKYEDIVRKLVERPERLFTGNTSVRYDITGLYNGANTVELNVSKNRFIEPEPNGPYRYRVLFLGGSTTEAIYVPQDKRWVALLNEPGAIAAYNASQSGLNTIDAYFNFLYFTGRGWKFDLVVLASGKNDMGWLGQFDKHGHQFRVEEYKQGLHDYYIHQYGAEGALDPPPAGSAIYSLTKEALRQVRQFFKSAVIGPVISPMNVSQIYLDMRKAVMSTFSNERRPADVSLMDRYPNLEGTNRRYRANAVHNIGILNQAVNRTGAKLLVVTEATSWMAPSSSFFQDLRIPSGMFSFEDLHEYSLLLNEVFLTAAREAGALTYDLAAEVNPHSNGPQGGQYMYDSMHYTPDGCRLAANFMRPVLHRLLEQRNLD
jgi:hypothetical protein